MGIEKIDFVAEGLEVLGVTRRPGSSQIPDELHRDSLDASRSWKIQMH
jgi:hypothetical protein